MRTSNLTIWNILLATSLLDCNETWILRDKPKLTITSPETKSMRRTDRDVYRHVLHRRDKSITNPCLFCSPESWGSGLPKLIMTYRQKWNKLPLTAREQVWDLLFSRWSYNTFPNKLLEIKKLVCIMRRVHLRNYWPSLIRFVVGSPH
jgi:hypothetical protein